MGDVIVAGHICVDMAPELGHSADIVPGELLEIGALAIRVGGCVANTGHDLAELGVPIRLVATISDDELGRFVRRQLDLWGLPTAELAVSSGAGTSYSIIFETPGTDRSIWHYPGANALFDGADVELSGASLLHFGYPSLTPNVLRDAGAPLKRLLARARRAGLTTSLDLAVVDGTSDHTRIDWQAFFANVLPEVDVFSPSLDDLRSALGIEEPYSAELVDRLCAWCIDLGVAVVSVSAAGNGMQLRTAGAERLCCGGAVVSRLPAGWSDRSVRRPAIAVGTVRTTTGAGDAGTAGLLYGLWSRLSPEETMYSAASCAAVVIAGGVPTRQVARQWGRADSAATDADPFAGGQPLGGHDA